MWGCPFLLLLSGLLFPGWVSVPKEQESKLHKAVTEKPQLWRPQQGASSALCQEHPNPPNSSQEQEIPWEWLTPPHCPSTHEQLALTVFAQTVVKFCPSLRDSTPEKHSWRHHPPCTEDRLQQQQGRSWGRTGMVLEPTPGTELIYSKGLDIHLHQSGNYLTLYFLPCIHCLWHTNV